MRTGYGYSPEGSPGRGCKIPITDPWDWYGIFTYIHLVDFYGKLVGKYTIYDMDPSC